MPRLIHLLLFLLCIGVGILWDQRAAQAADPVLSISNATKNVFNGTTFQVPVSLANNTGVATAGFSLDIAQSCLTFDAVTDSNGDGIPNSVTGLPSSLLFASTVSYNASDVNGEIDVTVRSTLSPVLGSLPAGTIAIFEFGIKASCRTTDGTQPTVAFAFGNSPVTSFGGLLGLPVTGTATGGTITLRFNAYPTNITLSAASVNENLAKNTTIGTLTSADLDLAYPDSHTYSLVSGTGSTNNASFVIAGTALKTNEIFDREFLNSYSIRLRTTDSFGGTFDKVFTITINDVNEAPTSISLTASTVAENLASGTTIGTLSSFDQDVGATATYAFATGTGDTNNGAFTLTSGVLKTALTFNYEISQTQNIRIRATDNGGLTFDSIFTINISNVNDAPVAVDDNIAPTVISGPVTLDVRTNDTDQDSDTLTITAVGAAISGTTSYSSTAVTYTPSANYSGVVSFAYTISDNHSGGALTDSGDVTLQVVANKSRGDCNGDGAVNAGDFSAIILEEVDDDGTPNYWYNSYLGSFAGSPRGCDANASEAINVADLSCTVLVFFGNSTCTSTAVVAAAQALSSSVAAIGEQFINDDNRTVTVPLDLQTNANHIAAASFTLAWDPQQLAFDMADADGDDLPDNMTLHLPNGMTSIVNYSTTSGHLDITVFATQVPMPLLADGRLADITLQLSDTATMGEIPIMLIQGSLGSDEGQSLPVVLDSGLVRRELLPYHLYLPSVLR